MQAAQAQQLKPQLLLGTGQLLLRDAGSLLLQQLLPAYAGAPQQAVCL